MSKRCIESKLIYSDKFLAMPLSARMLYIYLNLEADNYGFLASANGTINHIGATQSDLELLIENEFILRLSKDVYCITDWFIHNKADTRLTPDFDEYNLVELRNKKYYLKDRNLIDDGKYHFLPSDTL